MTLGSNFSTSSEKFRPGLSIACWIFPQRLLVTEIDGAATPPPAEGRGRTRPSRARVNISGPIGVIIFRNIDVTAVHTGPAGRQATLTHDRPGRNTTLNSVTWRPMSSPPKLLFVLTCNRCLQVFHMKLVTRALAESHSTTGRLSLVSRRWHCRYTPRTLRRPAASHWLAAAPQIQTRAASRLPCRAAGTPAGGATMGRGRVQGAARVRSAVGTRSGPHPPGAAPLAEVGTTVHCGTPVANNIRCPARNVCSQDHIRYHLPAFRCKCVTRRKKVHTYVHIRIGPLRYKTGRKRNRLYEDWLYAPPFNWVQYLYI